MSWHVYNQRLPTRANLDKPGIDLELVLRPTCNSDIKTEVHVFVTCSVACNIWKDVFAWWHLLDTPTTTLEDLVSLSDRVPLKKKKFKPFFDVVVNNTIRSIWNYRNKVLFNLKRPRNVLILNGIKTIETKDTMQNKCGFRRMQIQPDANSYGCRFKRMQILTDADSDGCIFRRMQIQTDADSNAEQTKPGGTKTCC
ncbi:RNA-directed DNA polymerase, eukaryota, reverse transcriptase zinc-binding domain protein [Tanacetum coccineum]